VEDALRALELVGVTHRRDVYWALHAVFVSRHEQEELFGHAFAAFWRDPSGSNDELAQLQLPPRGDRTVVRPPRRILEAWQEEQRRRVVELPDDGAPADAPGTASARELLRRRDFEEMSAEEIDQVKAILRRMRFPWRDRPTRRWVRGGGPRIDLRETLQRCLRSGGEPVELRLRERRVRPPPLVVLCDISGSMERYSRMVLHFLHALTNDRDRVEVFTFGTRLTRITRALRHRDVDRAFAELSARVPDWGGGTRVGACLEEFNRRWARRVLTGGAELLLVSDGLEREDGAALERQVRRLAAFAPRIVWLNPLLGFDGYRAEAEGPRILARYVREHRPVHDLASLEALAEALGG
jgi:hypothetical protein